MSGTRRRWRVVMDNSIRSSRELTKRLVCDEVEEVEEVNGGKATEAHAKQSLLKSVREPMMCCVQGCTLQRASPSPLPEEWPSWQEHFVTKMASP
jgi:hypothetical protein